MSVRPDSGAVLSRFTDAARIQFDEVISERSGGGLDRLVRLSPRAERLDVKWKRSAVEVKPAGGWRDSVVYQLTVLPGVADLSDNRTETGRTVIFSTGIPIPATTLAGIVLDWEAGRAARNALIEAVRLADSLVYVGQAGEDGSFALGALPPARYAVYAVLDANSNGRRDRREAFDSVIVQLDSTASHVYWTFTHDSAGPALRRAVAIDSVTARLEFSQRLALEPPILTSVTAWALPDTVEVPHVAVWRPETYEAARRTTGDTAGAGAAVGADSAAAPAAGPPARPGVRTGAPQAPDTSQAARLLAERPRLVDQWIVRFATPLVPGGRYLLEARAQNVLGVEAITRTVLAVPEAPPTQ